MRLVSITSRPLVLYFSVSESISSGLRHRIMVSKRNQAPDEMGENPIETFDSRLKDKRWNGWLSVELLAEKSFRGYEGINERSQTLSVIATKTTVRLRKLV
jgi:hypothetical protein